MEENEFMLKLVAMLDKSKSKKQADSSIKELEKVVRNLRLTATLLKGKSKQEINQAIKQIEGQLQHIRLQAKIDQKNLKSDIDKALQNISFKDLKDIDINVDSSKTKLKVQKALADVKKAAQSTPISVNVDLKKEKLGNDLTSYLLKHSKVRESESLLKQVDSLRDKISGINDSDSLRNVTQEFQLFKSECASTGYAAKSSTEKIKGLIGNATKIGSAFGVASMAVSNFQKSLKTIKTNDSITTEISKTSNMTKEQLNELSNESFDIASKYGRLSQDFLLGVQEMARSGYETASKGMAELSLMAQAAGDMSADLANNYIIATDNAYKLNGEVDKLNAVLDGQNSITNRNSVALQDMAEGMSKAGTVASSYNVAIEDLSAMIGTMEAVTKSGGSEVGNAIKAILINLQNVTSDKIVDTLDAANASMTEFVDGTEKLRNPIDILRDLAKTFNQLDEDDPLRAEILTNVGQKYHASKLGALLQNMDMFDKMLVDYSEGAGSALEEADKSANDLTGTLNRLSNSWDELVNSITNKSALKGGVGFFDTLLQSATKLIDTVDVLPVALAGVTAFMTAKNKDMGLHVFNNEGKFDLSGNFMGIIDVDQIKHYKAASEAIDGWNQKLKNRFTDLDAFKNKTVQNTAQLKEYLKTCSVDAPASLKGYKAHLQAAGEATTSLRLGTILLNSALSFGLGLCIQGVISGLDYLIHKEEKEAEALEEAKNKFTQTTDEIKSLNDELSSTQDKIAELQKLADSGTISVADENELKLLKETNKELQRKIALKQKEQIDDAKRVLENVRKNNKEKQYSISYYKPDGTTATKRKKGDASEYLQDMIEQYENVTKYSERDDTFKENANKNISKQAEKVADLIDAYERLKDAGVELTKGQQAEYESALKAQDAYLLYSYNLNKTKEGFRALNEEQKRSILNDRLLGQGLTGQEVKVVLKYIPEEDLDDYYGFDFGFPLPDRKDYKTAEEYGKAYAEAWKNGVESAIRNNKEEVKPLSFKEAWKALDNTDNESLKDLKEDLLELAKQGKLTVAEFNKTTGAKSWLEEVGISAEEAVKKINDLKEVSSADQLSSMGSGIKSLSDNLATKKESPKKAINYDTLAGMSDGLKECTEAWKNYEKVMGTASSTYEECSKATDKLAAAFINSNNFLANLTNSTKDYYTSQLQAMGISNAEAIVTAVLAQRHREAAEAKQIESIKNEVLAITKNGVTNETLKEVSVLFQEQGAAKTVQYAIVDLIAQEQILSNTSLGVDDKIQQLRLLAQNYYGAAAAADFMNKVQTSADGALYGGGTVSPDQAWKQVSKENKPKKPKKIKPIVPTPAVSPISYSTPKPSSSGDKGKSSKKKDSKQLIDWIERKLDVLQDKIDLTKAKFENLFSVRKKKNNLNTQIKQTTKLLNNEQKAIAKYQKKADSIKLPGSLKKNVREGRIKGSLSELIKEYGEKTANQIGKYQDYIDKIKDAKKAVQELKAEIRELSKQKLDLKLDDNDRKRTYQEARYANATTAKQKHKILNKEINTYKSDDKTYTEYYKESKKQRKKDGKKAETAVSNTKGLGKSAKNKIKKLIKQGKEIPSALMKKVKKHSIPAYNKLLDYNNSVDFVSDALRDKKLANEQNETNIREKRIERAQNYADEAEAKYNLNQQYEANAASAKDKNKYEAKSLKYLDKQYAKLIKVAELEGDATEQKRLQAELEAKRKESYQTQYDNIKTEYDNKTGLNDALISKAQAQIATLEAAGVTVSKEMYRTMMQISGGTKKRLLEEREELLEAGKDFKYGSAEWCAWQDDLLAIDQQLESCTQNTFEWQKKMNELDFKKFSLFAQQLDATGNHLGFLVDMLSHQDLTSKESGGLTDAGFATISLRFSSIENYRQSIKNAQDELEKLYEKHADGSDFLSEEEFLAKREEQLDIIRQGTEAIEDEKEAILDLVNDAMELQIDSINELIEKKKKALATEKDLYSYQQRVAKQTKNIALIEKQIAALSGDKSEEARARTQKLQASLEEAQQDLKDTEYDKWHEDQNEMLDSLADEVEEFWEKLMNDLKKNIDGSLDNILKMVTDNPDAVARALDELGLGDALSIITTYNPDGTHGDKAIDYGGNSYESTYNKDGDNINSPMKGEADAAAENLSNAAKNLEETERLANAAEQLKDKLTGHLGQEDKKPDKEPERQPSSETSNVKNNATEGKDSIAAFLKSSALHKPTTEAGKKRMKTDPLLKYVAKNYNGKTLSNVNEAKLGSYLGITVKDKNNVSNSEAQKILKAFKGAGFADGGIAATLNRAAKENGDDGIITIQKGEAVLTKEQTENIREIAGRGFVPAMPLTGEQVKFLTEYMNTPYDLSMQMYGNIPPATTTNTSVNTGDINIHMDGTGVIDPKSFCDTFRRSNEMQRAIQAATIDQIIKPYSNSLF